MNIIGIICEYNPFHNGHVHHLNEIKKIYPDSLIVLVLNGYFMQRGEISIISKKDKVQIALESGIDLIIELPTLYGTQSADTFAYNAIYLLNKLNVTHIVFGSESNNINTITSLAERLIKKENDNNVKLLMDEGYNYPTALSKSLNSDFKFMSNDLLAISYVKAILKINKNIIPVTIQRTNDYLDLNSNEQIISASNIRNKLNNNIDIKNYLPKYSLSKVKQIDYKKYFDYLKLLILRDNNLERILDVNEGIEYRLKEMIKKANNLNEYIELIKTKRYTYNKINRMLIHILLNIQTSDAKITPDYLKILGFNQKGKKYLQKLKKNLNSYLKIKKSSIIYNYELKSSLIYDLLTNSNDNYLFELSNKPIIFDDCN